MIYSKGCTTHAALWYDSKRSNGIFIGVQHWCVAKVWESIEITARCLSLISFCLGTSRYTTEENNTLKCSCGLILLMMHILHCTYKWRVIYFFAHVKSSTCSSRWNRQQRIHLDSTTHQISKPSMGTMYGNVFSHLSIFVAYIHTFRI